jgi:hypothetical protein
VIPAIVPPLRLGFGGLFSGADVAFAPAKEFETPAAGGYEEVGADVMVEE